MNYASIILNMNRLQTNEMMRGLSNGPQEKLVSLNNKKKSSGLFFIITVTLRHHEQVFNYTTSIVTHH